MTDALYFHCNDARRAPWADLADHHMLTDVSRAVTCELAQNHGGDHADHLDYLGLGHGDMWAYWNGPGDHVTYAAVHRAEWPTARSPRFTRIPAICTPVIRRGTRGTSWTCSTIRWCPGGRRAHSPQPHPAAPAPAAAVVAASTDSGRSAQQASPPSVSAGLLPSRSASALTV